LHPKGLQNLGAKYFSTQKICVSILQKLPRKDVKFWSYKDYLSAGSIFAILQKENERFNSNAIIKKLTENRKGKFTFLEN
jgi:hypothetical protein